MPRKPAPKLHLWKFSASLLVAVCFLYYGIIFTSTTFVQNLEHLDDNPLEQSPSVLGRLFNDKNKNSGNVDNGVDFRGGRKRLKTLTPESTFTEHTKNFWIEPILEDPEPRIYILHNIATAEECAHLVQLGTKRGMERAQIVPYGGTGLIDSNTRTNTGAWLDFQQDPVVSLLERRMADATGTVPTQGEALQVLHYEKGQKFEAHQDFFDPLTDPEENFIPGGNRLATVLLYINAADKGGETAFPLLDPPLKLVAKTGDAVLFFNMKPDGDVDRRTKHAGTPPIQGDKWVATKWIHETTYQVDWVKSYGRDVDAKNDPTVLDNVNNVDDGDGDGDNDNMDTMDDNTVGDGDNDGNDGAGDTDDLEALNARLNDAVVIDTRKDD